MRMKQNRIQNEEYSFQLHVSSTREGPVKNNYLFKGMIYHRNSDIYCVLVSF